MPHLPVMQWDFMDRLAASARQVVNDGASETTFYQYDAAGQRARKVTERRRGHAQNERLYVGGFEIYREYDGDGDGIALERETLHVMDDKERIALVETLTARARKFTACARAASSATSSPITSARLHWNSTRRRG